VNGDILGFNIKAFNEEEESMMSRKLSRLFLRGMSVIILDTLFVSLLSGPLTSAYAAPGDLTRVSVDSAGVQANGGSRRDQISGDGRFVVFESDATSLVGGTGGLFLKDRQTGAVTRVGVDGENASISNDGRFIAFDSGATNEVTGDTNGFFDIFVFDRQSGLTSLVSVDSGGVQANADSLNPAISSDGRYVAFSSDASNLVSADANGVGDIFVHDLQTGATERVSIATGGTEGNAGSSDAAVSADGRIVVFSSSADNLVSGDTNGRSDVFARDRQTGTTTRISVNSSGAEADGGASSSPAISGDGRYVVFLSRSGNLDPRADEYFGKDLVYVHDRQIGQTVLASVASDGSILTVGLFDQPTISSNGRYVAFSFYDKGDNNGRLHIWVRDLQTGESIKEENGNDSSGFASLSADGTVVAFSSGASNLISGDTNGASDVFVREIVYGPERNPTVAAVAPECGFSRPVCTYPTHASVSFTVLFSEPVTGVTADDFSLDMLEGITGASITGVSGSAVQYFVTVDTGTGDGKLRLNVIDNDSIQDTALNLLGGVGAGNGNFTTGKPYQIEKSSPTITRIVRADPNPTSAEAVRFTVTFSELVYPVRPSDFILSTTGSISGAAITAIDPREDQFTAAATYTVTVNSGTGDGTLRLDLIDDDSILDNFIGNPLGGPGAGNGSFTTGETYTINKSTPSAPSVTSVLRVNPNPAINGYVDFTVTFSEAVTGIDGSDFALTTTGSISGASLASILGSGSTYTVTVNTGLGDGTVRLDVMDDDSLVNGLLNPLGGSGVGNGNFSAGEAYTVHPSTLRVISILRMEANPTAAATVNFLLTFSEAVTGVDPIDFNVTTTGSLAGTSVVGVSGSAAAYVITVSTGSGNGDLRLDLMDGDTIVDSLSHPLGGNGIGNGNFLSGEAYTVSKFTIIPVTTTFRSTGARDGWILEQNENSSTGGSKNSNASFIKLGDDGADRQFRSILHFPTYYLPDNAVITQAILMIKKQDVIGTDPFTTHQNIAIDIRRGLFSSFNLFSFFSLQLTDFQAPADMYTAGTIQNNPVSGWYWATLDSGSFQFISLTDITQIRLAFQLDDNDDMGEDAIRFFSGDYSHQTERPHLQIEYYLPR
jgi:Tol biopolymer transport system component